MTSEQDIDNLFSLTLSKENVDYFSQEIVNSFTEIEEEKRMVDFEFDLKGGQMSSPPENTWIRFDAKENSVIKNVLDLISDEKIEPTEKRMKLFDDFLSKVKTQLQTKYIEKLKDALRLEVFGEVEKELFPLNTLVVKNIEISDNPDVDYSLSIEKRKSLSRNDKVNNTGISQFFYEEIAKTKKTPQQILEEKKQQNDPMFEDIVSIKTKKAFFNCNIDLFVDYSANDKFKPKHSNKVILN
jgi:hypothetical protein